MFCSVLSNQALITGTCKTIFQSSSSVKDPKCQFPVSFTFLCASGVNCEVLNDPTWMLFTGFTGLRTGSEPESGRVTVHSESCRKDGL